MQNNAVEQHCSRLSGLKIILHALAGILILMVSNLSVSLFFDIVFALLPFELAGWIAVVCCHSTIIFVCYHLLLLYVRKFLQAPLSDCRIKKPYLKAVYLFCAVVLPVGVSFALMATGGTFVNNSLSGAVIFGEVIIALCYALTAGIVEEMIFRGYMMKVVEAKWGKTVAVLVPSILFGALHVTSMKAFSIISLLQLLCAGTAVGIMFSLITYQSKSIWSSALIHTIWNFVMIGGILEIGVQQNTQSVFSFVLSSQNTLITGGGFGIEASVFAIAGYVVVALLALYLYKNKNARNWEGLGEN